MKSFVLPALLLALVLLGGCGGDDRVRTVPVKGTLYLDDQPHGPARLLLSPISTGPEDKRPTVGGEVNADGTFALTTHDLGDGAPPGQYRVSITSAVDPASVDPADMQAQMSGPAVEPLNVEVPAEGTSTLELRLKKVVGRQAAPGELLGQ